jgi:restriction endonuclease S subunit
MFRSNVPPAGLPSDWSAKQLQDIARVYGGGRLGLTKSDYVDRGTPAYSAAGQDGYVREVEGDEPSIILSSIGARCGKSFLAEGPWATLANTQVITPDPSVAEASYLIALLDNESYWNRSGSAQPFIKPSDVKGAWISLPPLDEQRRIAEVVRSLDQAIAAATAAQAATKKVFARIRAELLGDALRRFGEIPVADAIAKNRGEKLKKLQTSEYQEEGAFPIVDQGASFICGYTDDQSALWPYALPVIVFGDHTRILKFVDFPFAIGADGTQCLTPTPSLDARYFYYALQSLDLQGEGYARHFKLLKEKVIPVPDREVQLQIADQLLALEQSVASSEASQHRLRQTRRALMTELLSGRVRVPA